MKQYATWFVLLGMLALGTACGPGTGDDDDDDMTPRELPAGLVVTGVSPLTQHERVLKHYPAYLGNAVGYGFEWGTEEEIEALEASYVAAGYAVIDVSPERVAVPQPDPPYHTDGVHFRDVVAEQVFGRDDAMDRTADFLARLAKDAQVDETTSQIILCLDATCTTYTGADKDTIVGWKDALQSAWIIDWVGQ